MDKDWYVTLVEIKGTASDYASAGHGVKHRLMDAGFKEENIKIVQVRKFRTEEVEAMEADREPPSNPDVQEIIDLYENSNNYNDGDM